MRNFARSERLLRVALIPMIWIEARKEGYNYGVTVLFIIDFFCLCYSGIAIKKGNLVTSTLIEP